METRVTNPAGTINVVVHVPRAQERNDNAYIALVRLTFKLEGHPCPFVSAACASSPRADSLSAPIDFLHHLHQTTINPCVTRVVESIACHLRSDWEIDVLHS